MAIKRWIMPEIKDCGDFLPPTVSSPLLRRVLQGRGYGSEAELQGFLEPDAPLCDPFALKDMDKAAERIRAAVENGERIAVFGDFDCDGITSSALLTGYLQTVGADVVCYVPDRETEGYGMNIPAVEALYRRNVSLIITVDNGISAHAEVARASELGIDVVITDHHTPRSTLPQAIAVVNPHRADDQSGLDCLAGVGVAFKLICALEGDADGSEMLEFYSDLAMIGTVADVVPLTGENRSIVRHGLDRLAQTERTGLLALLEVSGLEGKPFGAETIAFTIAPRLNAAGRLGRVDRAIELLLTDDPEHARELAAELNEQNIARKRIEDEVTAEIGELLERQPELLRERLLLVSGEGWHHGVLGIVAARLLERTGKPVIVFSLEGETARGSARSLPGFSIIEAISSCGSLLTRYGGHPLAAGVTLEREKLVEFIRGLLSYAREHHPWMPRMELEISAIAALDELSVENVGALSSLEPCGAGNRPPLFLIRGVRIGGVCATSDGKHLRIRLTDGKTDFTAVYFRMNEESFPYRPGDTVDLVASVSASPYAGKMRVSMVIRDLRRGGIPQDDIINDAERYACHLRGEYGGFCEKSALLPSREDVAVVYRFLRGGQGFCHGEDELFYRIAESGISYGRMLVSLDVLEELSLISRIDQNGRKGLFCLPDPPRVDLESSGILRLLRQ